MSLPSRLLGANPSIQVSTLLSGTLTTPSAKGTFAPPAFESIATVTAAGGESSLSFTSIPQTYASLQIRMIARFSASAPNYTQFRVNSDTGANYVWHRLYGDGTSALTSASTGSTYTGIGKSAGSSNAAGIFAANIVDFHNYSSTTQNKTIRSFSGIDANTAGTDYQVQLASALWLNTAAITSIQALPDSGTWAAGTTFSLYGIKGA